MILVLTVLGQVFKVEEYTTASLPGEMVGVEENKVEEVLVESTTDANGEAIEIIKWPAVEGSENKEEMMVPLDDGVECLFFDEEIPRLDKCEN